LSVEKAMMMDKKDNEKITSLENQMQNVLKALAPLTEMLNQKEVKIPMSDFPKEVQEKLQQRLNHN
jgi:ribosome maturation protein Sdo1